MNSEQQMNTENEVANKDEVPKKRFGHTSDRQLPQYIRYDSSKKGRREIIPPPVKARHIKRSRLRMKDTHPLRRLAANWERKASNERD